MQVPFKNAFVQSFARHCCSSKKQVCINQRFKLYKNCLGSKGSQREPISKSCQGRPPAPRQLRHCSIPSSSQVKRL